MKNVFKSKRKLILISVIIVILVTAAAIPTVAWLTRKSAPVTNTFTEAVVSGEVVMTGSSPAVKNTGDITAYVRMTIVPSFCDASGNTVAAPTITMQQTYLESINLSGSDWIRGSDGYFYYKYAVEPADTTDTITMPASPASGTYTFTVNYHTELVQAQPSDAVAEAWNVSLAGGVITG